MSITLDDLRSFAVARSLFPPTSLQDAVERLSFVQADPIRAPARAQDLTLRHRVENYRAGDLERQYGSLAIEEDVFINYGFVTGALHALMHPRDYAWSATRRKRARAILEFVQARGSAHPREVDAQFSHGSVTNYWGGTSKATTHLMDEMHYRGLLRVVRREGGVRIYGIGRSTLPAEVAAGRRDNPRLTYSGFLGGISSQAGRAGQGGQAGQVGRASQAGEACPDSVEGRLDRLIDVLIDKYAPVPAPSLAGLIGRLRYAVPQFRGELTAAATRASLRLAHTEVDGVKWYWPAGEELTSDGVEDAVRFLAPFDPVVWDRRRFEMFWDWAYRFEAYTPVKKRTRGYYALPMLWRDRVIGWGNISANDGLHADVGYVRRRPPRDRAFRRALDMELNRIRAFLQVDDNPMSSG